MPVWLIILIVVVAVIIVVAVGWLVSQEMKRKRLQRKFGPEYERVVRDEGGTHAAERELAEREKRHAKLDIRPLSAENQRRYAEQWTAIQERFVDQPVDSVRESDQLLVALMAERGYPTEDFDQQVADLSVEHSRTLEHYRTAHSAMRNGGRDSLSTEDLRDAMLNYRVVFEDLLGEGKSSGRGHDTRPENGVRGRHGVANDGGRK